MNQINPVVRHDLSLGQKELWYIHSMGGLAQSAYNESLVYTLEGYLSVSTLKKAFAMLIDQHDVLRTFFDKDQGGNLYQQLHGQVALDFTLTDKIDKAHLTEFINAQITKPFDLTCAPLMRVSLIQQNDFEHILVIVLHHIITDGTSFSIFIQELSQFYNQLMAGDNIPNSRPDMSYFDHVRIEKEHFLSTTYLEQVDTVAQSLKGYSGLNFLTTPIYDEKTDIYSGNRVYFTFDKTVCLKLSSFCQSHRTTVFNFLYSAYCVFLSRYTRSQDVLVGVPFANRQNDLEGQLMGYFINTVPMRTILNDQQTFSELVTAVKSLIFSFFCQQDVAFEHIGKQLDLDRKTAGQHPLIQTLFVWGNTDKLDLNFEGINTRSDSQYYAKTSKFDLSLFMLEQNKESITAYFEYRDALFDRKTIENMANSFSILINNILENPFKQISAYSLLNESEMQRMKEALFTAKLDRVVTHSLCDFFSETVSRYSQHIGLIFGNNRYDYANIELRSNQWASYIRYQYAQLYKTELPPDTLVALCVDRNEDMIFGLLGILKAGAAYVPVDPKYPQNRINYIISHSQAPLLLTHKKHKALNLDVEEKRIIYMDDELVQRSPHFLAVKLTHSIDPRSLAYVLYTSGTTGRPKGVGVTHENIICLFESLKKQFELSSQDVWSLFHTFCFDISVWEIWGAFLFGGTLVVIPFETTRDSKQFYQLIESEGVTVLTQTASAFQLFINEDLRSTKKLERLRYVSFVGESLKVSILRPWVAKYGTATPRLANMYGITETTVYTNNKFIDQIDIDKGRDNIGWPVEEFSMCIMDDQLQWCPVGIVGEICIGGRGLSRGYLYRDDLTQEKFITDPYAAFLGLPENTRLYRTGDLGRWMNDGSIEYLGRKDLQVKLRGFRIELGEIESTLGSYKGISHTVVLLKGEGETAYLSAYYTIIPDSQVELSQLRVHLSSFLPDYMVPTHLTELESFPMTINGKIDRSVLSDREDKVSITKNNIPLRTFIEIEIASVWSEMFHLDVTELYASSNFFGLGGNSLLVVKMLTLVNNKLKTELSLSRFIALPTIAALAAQVSSVDHAKQNADILWEQLKRDRMLDQMIQPLTELNPLICQPKIIFITGVTGFIGAHVLYDLLETTSADIYCLVRASSSEKALTAILAKLKKYRIFSAEHVARIFPVIGDLSVTKLGLSDQDFDWLTKEVDSLFHVGAWVHHIFDYHTLYKTNVQSVLELLTMAVSVKNKAFHFVSTLATGLISPIDRLPTVDHASFEAYLNLNGYLTTKWIAEQLLKEASSRGIATHVYRPGNVVAGKHGVCEAQENHTLLRLKGMLQLEKSFVTQKETVEMMPVDLLAAAMVAISASPSEFSYNLNNAQTISWIEYLQIARRKGYPLTFIQEEEWNSLLKELDEHNALYKLSHLYKTDAASEQDATESLYLEPDYRIATPSYEDMVEQQLSSLIASGFLIAPSTAPMNSGVNK